MLSHYRASLHTIGDPVARVLLRARVQPNQLTIVGLGVSVAAAHAFFQGRPGTGAHSTRSAGMSGTSRRVRPRALSQ